MSPDASFAELALSLPVANDLVFRSSSTGVTTCLNSLLTFGGTHPPFTIVISVISLPSRRLARVSCSFSVHLF